MRRGLRMARRQPVNIPDLEPHCGSWVCTAPTGWVVELYNREIVEFLAGSGWRVETAAQYLGRINTAGRVAN